MGGGGEGSEGVKGAFEVGSAVPEVGGDAEGGGWVVGGHVVPEHDVAGRGAEANGAAVFLLCAGDGGQNCFDLVGVGDEVVGFDEVDAPRAEEVEDAVVICATGGVGDVDAVAHV